MKLNWEVRIKNKNFWLALIPAFLVLVQEVLAIFGIVIDIGEIGNRLIDIVNSIFVLLSNSLPIVRFAFGVLHLIKISV